MSDYDPKDLIEVEPINKKEELLEFLKPYNPVVHTRADEGYNHLDLDLECISVSNDNGDVMDIELDGYWNFYFRGGHTHYWSYQSGWEELLEDLDLIFTNKLAMISYHVNGEWKGSGFLDSTDDNRDYILNNFVEGFNYGKKLKKGDNLVCKVRYWDIKDDKDYTFQF